MCIRHYLCPSGNSSTFCDCFVADSVWFFTSFPGPNLCCCCCCYFMFTSIQSILELIFCDSGEALENYTFLQKKEVGRSHGRGGWVRGRQHRVLLGYRFSPTRLPPPHTTTSDASHKCRLPLGLLTYQLHIRGSSEHFLRLWPPDVKSQFIRKDLDAGKTWGQEEKGLTEDEMVRWHLWLNGHEFGQTPENTERQGSLECSSPWRHTGSDMT